VFTQFKIGETTFFNRFSYNLCGDTDANFMFSPDFKSFIDVDYSQDEFLIRATKVEDDED